MASLHQRKPAVAVPPDASRVEENDEDSNGKVIKVADEAPLVKLMRALVPNLGKDLSPCESYIGQYEVYIPLVVFILALITRYYGLTDPAGVVFDEYHFGRFVNQYCAGTYLFDIHPPLGKLTLFFVGKLFGYDHTVCKYDAISDPYDKECKYWVLRGTAAMFGCLTAPLMYLITREFKGGVWAAVLCSCFFLFDNLNLIESRLVLIDSQLIFWCAAAMYVAQRWWRRLRENRDAGGTLMSGQERLAWGVAVGVVTSCSISVKWTGLATPGMIAVESFFGFFFNQQKPVPLPDLMVVLVVAFTLYYTFFMIHFALLPRAGDGDAFMRVEFQRMLINNSNYDPTAKHPGYLATFAQLNQEMLLASARIELRHNWESVWWEWPLNLRGLLYYSKDVPGLIMKTKTVYLLGNPAVIWLVGLLTIFTALSSAVHLRYQSTWTWLKGGEIFPFFCATGYCLWVYILNLLPYILVARSAFIYHYMPALMYAEIMSALMVEQLVGKKNMPSAMKVLLFLVIAFFLFYSPWVYAVPLTGEGHARRRLLKRWD